MYPRSIIAIYLNPGKKKTSPSACRETAVTSTVALIDGRLYAVPVTGLKLFIPSFSSAVAGILCSSIYVNQAVAASIFWHALQIFKTFLSLISLNVRVLTCYFNFASRLLLGNGRLFVISGSLYVCICPSPTNNFCRSNFCCARQT
jgi:hypothetical protein